ncbi:MAG: Cysteine synthase [Candidatus Nomurabacteria bacterium GW2011_GWA2_40_9]|uniref:Cysteine synthase n=1 Tax=Candidatus Nomurabacteria bacterium GW2011_GWA2_40_9 TaxID=1618734 RepID=A0A0G0TNW2_9BACT|nr:MAG: Cysteine synthase [Candidatus Nomurabacteria bacterium GW2011_GWA2_40_9]
MNTKMEEMFIKVDIQNPGHHLDTILIEDNDSSAVQIMPYHNLEGGTHKMVSCAGMYQRIPVGAQELIESTTGNTGYACAVYAQQIGMPITIFMPEGMPSKKVKILEDHGARVVQTPREEYTAGARNRAQAYYNENPETRWFLDQARNLGNWQANEELAYKLEGSNQLSLIGGTCGTIAGLGKGMKRSNHRTIITQIDLDAGPHFYNRKHGKPTEWWDHSIVGAAPSTMSYIGEQFYDLVDRVAVVEAKECEALFEEALRCRLNAGKSSIVNLAVSVRIARHFHHLVATVTYDDITRYTQAEHLLSEELNFDLDSLARFFRSEAVKKFCIKLEELHSDTIYQI